MSERNQPEKEEVSGRLVLLILSLNSCGVIASHADEKLRPTRPSEIEIAGSHDLVTEEIAVPITGVSVAWANYEAIRRDFRGLRHASNAAIDHWLVNNFSFVGADQSRLNHIRNSPIEVQSSQANRIAYRPVNAVRSCLMEALNPQGESMGMVSIKGFGHGLQSSNIVDMQVADFSRAQNQAPGSPELTALRDMHHSDGWMSLPEVISEISRQTAIQKVFELSGTGFETVESYAALATNIRILRGNGQYSPAAFLIRQANRGRVLDLPVSASIYVDPSGRRQSTYRHAAVDFGGAMLTYAPLLATFGDPTLDPQRSNAWRYAHDVALAWEHGDRDAIYRHLREMHAPIDQAYAASEEVRRYRSFSTRSQAFLEQALYSSGSNRRDNAEFGEVERAYDRWLNDQPETFASLESIFRRPEREARIFALRSIGNQLNLDGSIARVGRTSDSRVIPWIRESLAQDQPIELRRLAAQALVGRLDLESFELAVALVRNPDLVIRRAAAKAHLIQAMHTPTASYRFSVEAIRHGLTDSDADVQIFFSKSLYVVAKAHDPSTSELLWSALRSASSPDARRWAAVALRDYQGRDLADMIEFCMHDNRDPEIGSVAAVALERLFVSSQSEQAWQLLQFVVDRDPESELAGSAVYALSKAWLPHPPPISTIERALQNTQPAVRRAGCAMLVIAIFVETVADRRARLLGHIEWALLDHDENVRLEASRALSAAFPDEYVPVIDRVLTAGRERPEVRFSVLAGWVQRVESDPSSLGIALIDVVARALEDSDQRIRRRGAFLLSHMRPGLPGQDLQNRLIFALLRIELRSSDPEIQLLAAQTLPRFLYPVVPLEFVEVAFQSSEKKMRVIAMQALIVRADPGSLSLIERGLEDSSQMVRNLALYALYRRTDDAAWAVRRRIDQDGRSEERQERARLAFQAACGLGQITSRIAALIERDR